MAAIPGFMPIARKICESLGLEPTECKRIIVDIPCDGLVKVYVEKYMDGTYIDEFGVQCQAAQAAGAVQIVETPAAEMDSKVNFREFL